MLRQRSFYVTTGNLSFHDNSRDDDIEPDEIQDKFISEYAPVDDDADIDETEVANNGHELILHEVIVHL